MLAEPKTEAEIVNALLDIAGWDLAKRSIDATNTQEYGFWESAANQTVLSLLYAFQEITGGMFYADHRGYAVWESRNYRSTQKTTSSYTFNDTMADIEYELSDRDIWNDIRVMWNATEEGETSNDKTRTYTIGSDGQNLHLGEVYTYIFSLAESKDNAASWQNVRASVEKNGVEVSAQVTLTIVASGAKWCKVSVENADPTLTWPWPRLRWLSVDYTPYVPATSTDTPAAGGFAEGDFGVSVQDDNSIEKYGARTKYVRVPYVITPDEATEIGNFYLAYYKDPVPLIKVTIKNVSAALVTQMLTRHISDRITVVNSASGLNTDCFINKVEYTVEEGEHGRLWVMVLTVEKVVGAREFSMWDDAEWDAGQWAP